MKNPLVVRHIIKWYHFKFWQFKHLYTSVVHPAAASTFMQIVHKYTSIHTQRSEHTHAYITIKTPMTNRIINLWFLHVLQVHWHRHTHAINDMIDRCCCESCDRACVCAVRTICCVYEFYTVRTTRSLVRMLVSLLAHLFRPLFKLNSTRHNSLEPFQRKKKWEWNNRFNVSHFINLASMCLCTQIQNWMSAFYARYSLNIPAKNIEYIKLAGWLTDVFLNVWECVCLCVWQRLCVCLFVAAANRVWVWC